MGPAVMALVGVLLQVTLATESTYKYPAKNLKLGDVDRVISSALRQLSAAVYNSLSKERNSSLEEVSTSICVRQVYDSANCSLVRSNLQSRLSSMTYRNNARP